MITEKLVIETAYKMKLFQRGDSFMCGHCGMSSTPHYFHSWDGDFMRVSKTLDGDDWGFLELKYVAAWIPLTENEDGRERTEAR